MMSSASYGMAGYDIGGFGEMLITLPA